MENFPQQQDPRVVRNSEVPPRSIEDIRTELEDLVKVFNAGDMDELKLPYLVVRPELSENTSTSGHTKNFHLSVDKNYEEGVPGVAVTDWRDGSVLAELYNEDNKPVAQETFANAEVGAYPGYGSLMIKRVVPDGEAHD